MAITFEEKNNFGLKIAIISLFAVIILGIFGFLIWKLLSAKSEVVLAPRAQKIQIDTKILTDSRLESLELFPEIPPATISAVRVNPFVEDNTKPAVAQEPVVPN
jgi:hypothetical protein